MTEKKRLRLTAGKRQVPPTPKEPRLVIRKKKPPHPEQEKPLDHPGHLRNGEEAEAPESNPPYRAVTKELETTSPTDRSSKPDFALSPAPADVVLGADVASGELVALPYQRRDLGAAVIGRSGTGKSSLLEHLILADLDQGTPGVVIDPHGKLAERVVTLAPARAADCIVLLEPSVTQPFGLNLLAGREPIDDEDDPVSWAADSVVAAVKKLYGQQDEYLPRLEHYLDLAARTLIPSGGTLADAPRLFGDQAFRRACLQRVSDRSVRDDWTQYDALKTTEQVTHIEAVVNRLTRLLRPKIIAGMVGSPQTTVPFAGVLDGDTMMILSLPSERLTPERGNFVGALVLCALADRIFARTVTGAVHRLHLYLDEYQRFATATTAELLTQGRKYGVGVTLAHQGRGQLGDTGVQDAELQAGALVVLAVTRQDAEVLAGELPVTQREEWVEAVTVPAGTKPVKVPTRQPGQHLTTHGHPNPAVAAAGRYVFEKTLPDWSTLASRGIGADTIMVAMAGKLALEKTSPQWSALIARSLQVEIDRLLVDVMDSKLAAPEQLSARLLSIVRSTAYSEKLAPFHYDHDKANFYSYAVEKYKHWGAWGPEADDKLSSWLNVYLTYRTSPENIRAQAYAQADASLYDFLWQSQKTERSWTSPLGNFRGRVMFLSDHKREERLRELQERVPELGRQVQAVLTLCDGLAAEPILVPSGQEIPDERVQLVVHPRQPEQDARNELAGRLVNPREEYVAHVRLPGGGYHQVKLREPIGGTQDHEQLSDIRSRSRRRYAVTRIEETPPVQPPSADEPLTIGRFHSDEQ